MFGMLHRNIQEDNFEIGSKDSRIREAYFMAGINTWAIC